MGRGRERSPVRSPFTILIRVLLAFYQLPCFLFALPCPSVISSGLQARARIKQACLGCVPLKALHLQSAGLPTPLTALPRQPLLMSLWFAHPAAGITLAGYSRCSKGSLWPAISSQPSISSSYCSLDAHPLPPPTISPQSASVSTPGMLICTHPQTRVRHLFISMQKKKKKMTSIL